MSENVITTGEIKTMPTLEMIATEAPFQTLPAKALIAQIDTKTVVIDFQKPVVTSHVATRRRQRLFSKIYTTATITLIAISGAAAAYAMLTLTH